MKKVNKESPIENLTDEELDYLMKIMGDNYTNESAKRIHQSFEEKCSLSQPNSLKHVKKRYKWARVLLPLAATMILTVGVGYVKRDQLHEIYYRYFGTETQTLLANSNRLSEKATDKGFELKAIASFKTDETTYFISTIRDLEGNRLSEDTIISHFDMLSGGSSQVVAYDDTSKTATILTRAITFDDYQGTIGYQLTQFMSNRHTVVSNAAIDWVKFLENEPKWIDLSKQTGQGGGADMSELKKLNVDWDTLTKTGLAPLSNRQLLSNGYELSAVGMLNGLLHVQLKVPNAPGKGEGVFVKLKNKKTGIITESVASFQVDEGTHRNDTGRTDYEEHVFKIDATVLDQQELIIETTNYRDVIDGRWSIKLNEPKQLPTEKLNEIRIPNDIVLTDFTISPVDIRFNYQGNIAGMTMTIKKKNNQLFQLELPEDLYMRQSKEPIVWKYGYSELDDIQSISINQQVIFEQ